MSNPRATQSTGFEYLDVFAVALLNNQPEINYRSITISEVVVAMNPGGFCRGQNAQRVIMKQISGLLK